MNVFDLSARIMVDINGYLKGMDTAKAITISTLSVLGTELSRFMENSINVGRNFDRSMSQAAATLGNSMEDMEQETGTVNTAFGEFNGTLRDFAQFMGKNTAFTATEAAAALNYMALAGYDAQKSMEMLPNVMNLAAAGGFDLARASDMVTDAQTAFGLGSMRTSLMVDEMAKAASTGNTSVEQLGDAFLTVGALAKELNGGVVTLSDGTQQATDGVQEMEIALTAMANAGIKGSEAGTHMRNMIMKLSSPTKEGAEQLERMGVDIYDLNGQMKPLSVVFDELNQAMSRMTQQEKLEAISDLFNARDLASAESLLSAVGQDWDRIGESILNAQGSASKMAETQLDNLVGDTTLFNSALEGLQIALSDAATPALRNFTQLGTSLIQDLTGAFDALPEPMQTVISMIGLLGGKAVEMAPHIMQFATSLVVMKANAEAAGISSGGLLDTIKNFLTGTGGTIFVALAAAIAVGVASFQTFKANVEANTEEVRKFREESDTVVATLRAANDSVEALAKQEINSTDAATKLANAQAALDDITKGQSEASRLAADAQDKLSAAQERYTGLMSDWYMVSTAGTQKLNSEMGEAGVQLDEMGNLMNAFSFGAMEQSVRIATLAENIGTYSKALEENTEEEARAKENRDLAMKQVDAYKLLASDMVGVEREQTEATLQMLDIEKTAPEVYSTITATISNLNQAHYDYAMARQADIAEMQEEYDLLATSYENFTGVIKGTLESQFGFFNEMKTYVSQETYDILAAQNEQNEGWNKNVEGVGQSVTDMIAALDSQQAYMDTYQQNLDTAIQLMGESVSEDLVAKLSDGSTESAAILQSIVDDGGKNIQELCEKFDGVQEGKNQFINHMDSLNYDFGRQMRMTELRMEIAANNLNKSDEAYQSSMHTIQGAINGVDALAPTLISRYAQLGSDALSAYNSSLGNASPSKKFRASSVNTILGALLGVEGNKRMLIDAYAQMGAESIDAYQGAFDGDLYVPNGELYGEREFRSNRETERNNMTEITMNVYGSDGQDVNALAEIVIRRLQTQIGQEVAVFA